MGEKRKLFGGDTMRLAFVTAILSFGCICGPSVAEDIVIPDVAYPALAGHAASAEDFVPAGWRLESKISGDLNRDGREDVALVLRGNDPRNVVKPDQQGLPDLDTNPRILAVAFAAAAGGYDLVLANHSLIGRTTDPSAQDPLDPNGVQDGGVEIKNGMLRVTLGYFGGNMGHVTYTFRFQDGGFRLIGYDGVDVERSSGSINQVSVDYLAHRMKRSAGKIWSDTDKVTWINLRPRPLLTIERIGNGLEFSPPSE